MEDYRRHSAICPTSRHTAECWSSSPAACKVPLRNVWRVAGDCCCIEVILLKISAFCIYHTFFSGNFQHKTTFFLGNFECKTTFFSGNFGMKEWFCLLLTPLSLPLILWQFCANNDSIRVMLHGCRLPMKIVF